MEAGAGATTGAGAAAAAAAELVALAWSAAHRSYAPYTRGQSGVAIRARTATGVVVFASGGIIENAAFDPTVDPMQVALIDLIIKGTLVAVCCLYIYII
jgi:cytidine deaminase